MPDYNVDPSGNTEAFRAFTEGAPAEPAAGNRTPLIIGGAAAALAVIVVILLLTR